MTGATPTPDERHDMTPQQIAERMHELTHLAIDAAARETGGGFTEDRCKELQTAMWRDEFDTEQLIQGIAFIKANEMVNAQFDRRMNGTP